MRPSRCDQLWCVCHMRSQRERERETRMRFARVVCLCVARSNTASISKIFRWGKVCFAIAIRRRALLNFIILRMLYPIPPDRSTVARSHKGVGKSVLYVRVSPVELRFAAASLGFTGSRFYPPSSRHTRPRLGPDDANRKAYIDYSETGVSACAMIFSIYIYASCTGSHMSTWPA